MWKYEIKIQEIQVDTNLLLLNHRLKDTYAGASLPFPITTWARCWDDDDDNMIYKEKNAEDVLLPNLENMYSKIVWKYFGYF